MTGKLNQELGKKVSRGFTIIETLIAMAVFSVVLLLLVSGVMIMSKWYMKGVNDNATQSATRQISEQISQEIQFGSGISTSGMTMSSGTNFQYFCLGARKYAFEIGKQYSSDSATAIGNMGLAELENSSGVCSKPVASDFATARQLLSNKMRMTVLELFSSGNSYTINVGVGFGDTDLFCNFNEEDGSCPAIDIVDSNNTAAGSDLRCILGAGREYCAVYTLSSSVQRRLVQ